MKVLRVVLALVLCGAVGLIGALPAQAGAWAVTVLDPLPSSMERGRPYTVTFWVLQHGSHPYEGQLGEVGLTLMDDSGKAVSFAAEPLAEPAHYAATMVVPHSGVWRVSARQGVFADYRVGALTIPGRLTVFRPPVPMAVHDDTHWGATAPPDVAAMAQDPTLPVGPDTGFAQVAPSLPVESVPEATQAPRSAPASESAGSALQLSLAVASSIVGVALIGALWLHSRGRLSVPRSVAKWPGNRPTEARTR